MYFPRLDDWWHRQVLCRLGRHYFKFRGCVYCGAQPDNRCTYGS